MIDSDDAFCTQFEWFGPLFRACERPYKVRVRPAGRKATEVVATMPRIFDRFELSLPVNFRWKGSATFIRGLGTTRDITAQGSMFIDSDTIPPVSAIVRCFLLMPSLDATAADPYLLGETVGRVQRVEQHGFAVCARVFSLRNHVT